ncbi:MAG: 50S ribosomal protein L37ae [Nanoarchaeota archaeon]
MATKKVGSAGRFGARYGKSIRAQITEVEKRQRARHKCPYCNRFSIKRVASGIYYCRKCRSKFTGRAYIPGA